MSPRVGGSLNFALWVALFRTLDPALVVCMCERVRVYLCTLVCMEACVVYVCAYV